MSATLIILRDPAGLLGREVLRLHTDAPLQLQIEAAMPGGGAECELLINGQRADPFNDPRLDAPPQCGDTVIVAHRPAGPVPTWVLVASALLAVAAYALIPKLPDSPVASDSPNNRLTGQTNIARAYQAIPDVYGRRRVWPDLIQPSTIRYEAGARLVDEWLCVSRGIGTISAIQFADNALLDVDGASYAIFEPTATGTAPPGVPSGYAEAKQCVVSDIYEAFACEVVNGQEVSVPDPGDYAPIIVPANYIFDEDDTPVGFRLDVGPDGSQWDTLKTLTTVRVSFSWTDGVTGGVYDQVMTLNSYVVTSVLTLFLTGPAPPTTVNQAVVATIYADPADAVTAGPFTLPTNATRIRWNMVFPRGLDGTVEIQAEWWKVNSFGAEVGGSREDDTFEYTAATINEYGFTEDVTPAAGDGVYVVNFRRITADLGNGTGQAKLEALYALRYNATKSFPGVTIIKATTRTTPQATGIRERRFNCVFERHVRTLTTDTVSASRNFARIMAHLWTISGQSISDLDTTALAAINTDLGETDDLLRFDASLDDADVSLLERMQMIANHARCLFWRDGTKWTVTRDQARTTPELQLDYRNLAGSGDSTVSESFHLPQSHDGVELEYVDEASGSKKAYYRLNISSGSPVAAVCANPLKVKLPGCTTEAQAINRAQLEARKLLYQRTSVTDTALGDAQQLGPGSLARWIDPNDFAGDDGLQAGELMAIDGDIVTLSEPPDFGAETSGRIQFTGSDGMLLGSPIVCTPVSGQPYQVELASVPSGIYVASSPDSQVGSRYAFGVGLTESEHEAAGLYTVTEPRPNGDGTWQVSMVNYDARVYGFD